MARFQLKDDDDWADDDEIGSEDESSGEAECPVCGRLIYEDTAKCPHCGEWITPATEAERRSRTWRWPILIALLVVLILVAWLGLGR